jgi:cAMP-dependent protein kinase regulator
VSEHFDPPVYQKTPAQEAFLTTVLRDNFLFSDLTELELHNLVNAMEHETRIVVSNDDASKVIIRQGDVGDYFYIVESGKVDFILDGVKNVGQCGAGGSFGELALLYNSPRAVSCLATTPTVELFKVEQTTFRHLLAHDAAQHHASIKKLLKKINIFADFNDEDFSRFANSLTPVHWKEGARIVQKGEEGKVFYIVQEGTAKIHDIGLGDSQFEDQILGPGQWFGERALLTGEPRAANVTALTNVTTLAMDRETFESILGSLTNLMEREMRCHFLKGLPIFAKGNVTELELNQLVDLMSEVCYRQGDKLAEAGKPYEMTLWIIRHGRLLVYSSKPDSEGKIYNLQSGDHFGDKSIRGQSDHISTHTAICEENLTSWVLTKKDIESVLGDIDRLGEPTAFVKTVQDKTIRLVDLNKHRVLGEGAFGKVWLVSHNTSNGENQASAYALKAIGKRQLVDSKLVPSVLREKEMLCLLNHPFILHLVSSFQDERNVYLLLPIIPGGELFRVLHTQKKGKHSGLPNEHAAFYAACVIEALGHFHQRNIGKSHDNEASWRSCLLFLIFHRVSLPEPKAYRDLKLENILMDAQGYCTIIDLGFAKVIADKTYTLVGTPEYLAPEIIMSKGVRLVASCKPCLRYLPQFFVFLAPLCSTINHVTTGHLEYLCTNFSSDSPLSMLAGPASSTCSNALCY